MAEYVLYSKNIDDGFEEKIEEDIYKELYISKEILSEAHLSASPILIHSKT